MQDRACFHDPHRRLFIQKVVGSCEIAKASLQYPESSLNVLSHNFLSLGKENSLVSLRV
jgi:hypothetical protein